MGQLRGQTDKLNKRRKQIASIIKTFGIANNLARPDPHMVAYQYLGNLPDGRNSRPATRGMQRQGQTQACMSDVEVMAAVVEQREARCITHHAISRCQRVSPQDCTFSALLIVLSLHVLPRAPVIVCSLRLVCNGRGPSEPVC